MILSLAIRLPLAFLLRSYFAPDEYWQYQEVPYHQVFGGGYLSHEWDGPLSPMRSPLYHLPIQLVYWLLSSLDLDHPDLIAYAPRVMGAFTGVLFDVYLDRLLRLLYGRQMKRAGLEQVVALVPFGFWFLNYSLCRVLINSLETTVFTMSYYYWHLSNQSTSYRHGLFFYLLLIINFTSRPTSLIIYLPLLAYHLVSSSDWPCFMKRLGYLYLLAVACLVSSLSLDYLYFGRPVSSAFNFLYVTMLHHYSSLT